MNFPIRFILAAILLTFAAAMYALDSADSRDLISISSDTSFPVAVNIIETRLKAETGKIILDTSGYSGPIGIRIDSIHWKAAFVSILMYNGLEYTENDKAWIVRKTQATAEKDREEVVAPPNIPDDVMIQVTLFEADEAAIRESGVDWSTLSDGKVDVSTDFLGGTMVTSDLFGIQASKSFDIGSGSIDLNMLLKLFESEEVGHVLAQPQVTVASGEEAMMQDGTNFSIKTKDEAGNVTDKFFDSGTIIRCTPTVIEVDGKKYIRLKVSIERSSAEPGTVTTTEKITKTETIKMLFDGEETVISGLTNKEVTMVRKGIPLLKDLPWWVFGIRYLTGYNKDDTTTKEIIVILKATVLQELKDRQLEQNRTDQQIQDMRENVPDMENRLLKK